MLLPSPLILLAAFPLARAFDINTVDNSTKANFPQWCTLQTSSCENICQDSGFSVMKNDCDSATLAYHCICSNGISPNASEYTETIPYFQCTYDQQQCISKCPIGDTACFNQCNAVKCSATNPKKYNQTTQKTIGSPSGTGGARATPSNSIFSDASALLSNTGYAVVAAMVVLVMGVAH
ncbi:uncharacterized protein VTP21DRAFT_10751 [Calcarisporiella thermophila]|uniref:uncharacterized protein n=1 Tax=Calcarisporiella thermophila TaxID=911321 RepID=UPI0037448197